MPIESTAAEAGTSASGRSTASNSGSGERGAERIPQHVSNPQLTAAAVWRHAHGLAVVLSRDVATVADVEGLGAAWAGGVRVWLSELPDFPYLLLAATARDRVHRPSAFFARDDDALRAAVTLLGRRVDGRVLWVNCASDAAWKIVSDAVADGMSTEGAA